MNVFQIGTNKANDELTLLLKDKKVNLLVLIEPNFNYNNKINLCYSHVNNKFIENIVITPDPNIKEIKFYMSPYSYEHSSLDKNHLIKHGHPNSWISEIHIKCFTINEIFKKYDVKDVDILFIDAEGFDASIIRSINFSEIKIKNIYFENVHLNGDIKIFDYLKEKNYTVLNFELNNNSSHAIFIE
jgi:FkbM family methyltransferase